MNMGRDQKQITETAPKILFSIHLLQEKRHFQKLHFIRIQSEKPQMRYRFQVQISKINYGLWITAKRTLNKRNRKLSFTIDMKFEVL